MEREADGVLFLDIEFEVHGAGFGGCHPELGGVVRSLLCNRESSCGFNGCSLLLTNDLCYGKVPQLQ